MPAELFPYQVAGARFLAEKKRALLADEMGLGKSAQAIAACRDLGVGIVTVICPASVRVNWLREFAKFWPEFKGGPIVASYDQVVRDHGRTDWCGTGNNALILDEAHYLKTRTSKRTKAIFGERCDGVGGLVERARHVFLLTGTPTPNNPSEIWPMLRAVMPDVIGAKPLSYHQFIHRYCKIRDNGFGLEIVGGKNLTELRERMSPFVLRRKKSDVLKDLPSIRFDHLYLEADLKLPTEMLTIVKDVDKVLAEQGIEGLARVAPHVATLRRLTGLAKVAPTVDWLRDWLGAGNGKLVIFCHHRAVVEALAEAVGVDRSRKELRQMDRSRLSSKSRANPDDPLSLPVWHDENGSAWHVAPRVEHRVYEMPTTETRSFAGSDLQTLQHREVSREEDRRRVLSGLARDSSAEDMPAVGHSFEVEQSEVSSRQSLPGSIRSEKGLHQRECLGGELAGERHKAQRNTGGAADVDDEFAEQNAVGVVLTGDTPANERQSVVDRFQDDPRVRVFIGQIQAAGTGITLTAASDVVFVESSWVPAENEQAAMRVHRIGQRNACLVRFATLAGSIDERIQRAVMRKTQDITALFG